MTAMAMGYLVYRVASALVDVALVLDRWAARRQAPRGVHVYSETVVLPVSAEEETRPETVVVGRRTARPPQAPAAELPPAPPPDGAEPTPPARPHPRIRRWVTGPGHRASGRVLITPWARPALEVTT